MQSDKNRLYVALYARGGKVKMPRGEDQYHWALIIGPKREEGHAKGSKYHAKETITTDGSSEWVYDESPISMAPERMILTRILIAKIVNKDGFDEIARKTPIRPPNRPDWNCVSWVADVLQALRGSSSMGTSNLVWEAVRSKAMNYVEKKKREHRFDGVRPVDTTKVPTYDLITGTEIYQ